MAVQAAFPNKMFETMMLVPIVKLLGPPRAVHVRATTLIGTPEGISTNAGVENCCSLLVFRTSSP